MKKRPPLFVADIGGEVRPILVKGRSEESIYHTFNSFYAWNSLHDIVRQWIIIVRQWIISDELFNYDYTWLTPNYAMDMMKQWVSATFEHSLGVSLDDFELLAKQSANSTCRILLAR